MRPLVVFGLLLLVTVIAACQPVAFCEDKNWDGTCDVNGGNTCQGCTQEVLAVGQTKQFTNENCSVNVTLVSIDDKGTLFSVNGKEITLKENEEEQLEESRILLNKLQKKKANFSLKLECTKPCTTCSEKETCKGLEKGTCCEGTCIPKEESCDEQEGHICQPAKNCPGSWIPATDSKRCCNTTCETIIPECSQKNGHICSDNQVCPVAYTPAADSEKCCPQTCEPEIPTPSDEKVAAPWKIKMSSTGNEVTLHFGEYGDTPVPGDYDGDGVTDLAVWRRYDKPYYKGVKSTWIIKQSSDDAVVRYEWGNSDADLPAPGDYDGDGITDLAVARPADNTWRIKLSSGGTRTETFSPWANDEFKFNWRGVLDHWSNAPAPADFDGDGITDYAYFRPSTAVWTIKESTTGNTVTFTFGRASGAGNSHYDFGVPGDYDGDGSAEETVWRAVESEWHFSNSANSWTLGYPLDTPITGDFDGDGKDDTATFQSKPRFTANYLVGNLTNGHKGYDYQPSVMKDDDGKIRAWWCGHSPTGRLDAVYYATSTSPTTPFTNIQMLADGGCDVAAIKVPGSVSNRCSGNPVYYVYYEGDNMFYTYYPDGTVKTRTRQRDGNKILAKWSCDAENWNEVGQVIGSTGYFAPPGESISYGNGHPTTIFLDGTLYLIYYHQAGPQTQRMLLATSTDGEHFIEHSEMIARTVGGRVQQLEDANIFVGAATTNLSKAFFLYFGKDLGNLDYFVPSNQYEPSTDLLRIAESPKDCQRGGRFMTNPQGIINESPVYFFGAEWNTGPAGICSHQSDPDFSIDNSELYVERINLDIEESKCLGSMYRKIDGSVQSRTCTADGWSAWS